MSKNQIIKETKCINEYKWKYKNTIDGNAPRASCNLSSWTTVSLNALLLYKSTCKLIREHGEWKTLNK